MELTERSQTKKGRLARERVLAAAERVFTLHGFHGTGLREVAAEAEMPLAGVVYHFGKKETLYGAVLDEIAQSLSARLDSDPSLALPARIRAALDALASWAEEEPGRVRLLLRELADNAARISRATRLPLAPLLVRLSSLVAEGARAGVLVSEAPETTVLHLVGALSYFVVARPTLRRAVGAERERYVVTTHHHAFVAFAERALALKEQAHEQRSRRKPRPAGPRARERALDGRGGRLRDGARRTRLRG